MSKIDCIFATKLETKNIVKLKKIKFMEKFNEKVATENAQIFRMIVLEMIGDNISTCSELTATPNKRVGEIKEVWSLERLIQGFDMDNANISEGDSSLCINVKHTQDNVSASLAISWDMLTDYEMELIKGVA